MNKYILRFRLLIFVSSQLICNLLFAQAPDIEWQRCLGGSNNDYIGCIEQTIDGGYIAVGSTQSTDGDLTSNRGITGGWLVKLSSDGNIEWERTYNIDTLGVFYKVKQTPDGGYMCVGDKTIKVDAKGNLKWLCNISGSDIAFSNDGNYVVSGSGNVSIRKFDSTGRIYWSYLPSSGYLSGGEGGLFALIKTPDEYYVSVGNYSVDVSNYGILERVDKNGKEDYAGDRGDKHENDIALTQNSNFIIAGGDNDLSYLHLLDTGGGYLKNFTDTFNRNEIASIRQCSNGFIGCGWASSFSLGTTKLYVCNYDTSGQVVWRKFLGGGNDNSGSCIRLTTDGGFIIAGNTNSIDGDVKGNHGGYDGWIVKLKGSTGIKNVSQNKSLIQVYPTITKSVVNILLPDNKDASMVLLNSLGQHVNAKYFNASHNAIDLSNYSNGLYILQIYSDNNMQSFKIIKE